MSLNEVARKEQRKEEQQRAIDQRALLPRCHRVRSQAILLVLRKARNLAHLGLEHVLFGATDWALPVLGQVLPGSIRSKTTHTLCCLSGAPLEKPGGNAHETARPLLLASCCSFPSLLTKRTNYMRVTRVRSQGQGIIESRGQPAPKFWLLQHARPETLCCRQSGEGGAPGRACRAAQGTRSPRFWGGTRSRSRGTSPRRCR